jgi:hypothetical protein
LPLDEIQRLNNNTGFFVSWLSDFCIYQKCGVSGLGRLLVFLLTLNFLLGCGALSRPIDEKNVDQTVAAFSTGQITLGGYRRFQSGIVDAKNSMRVYYAKKDWENLAKVVIKSDFGIDLYWYYLGRSAEGLGFAHAAQTYYRKALSSDLKCKDLLIAPHPTGTNECDGVKIPQQVNERLLIVDKSAGS